MVCTHRCPMPMLLALVLRGLTLVLVLVRMGLALARVLVPILVQGPQGQGPQSLLQPRMVVRRRLQGLILIVLLWTRLRVLRRWRVFPLRWQRERWRLLRMVVMLRLVSRRLRRVDKVRRRRKDKGKSRRLLKRRHRHRLKTRVKAKVKPKHRPSSRLYTSLNTCPLPPSPLQPPPPPLLARQTQ